MLDGSDVVASHPRNWGRHQVIELPEHRAAILATKRQAAAPKGQDRLRAEIHNIEPILDRWFESGRNIGIMTAKTIRLLDLYGASILQPAVDEMLQRGTCDPGALAILCDQYHQKHKGPPQSIPLSLGKHVVECDVIQHDLEGYDV